MSKVVSADMQPEDCESSYLRALSVKYGTEGLNACQELAILWDQLSTGKRDALGTKGPKLTPAQIIPRLVWHTLQRFAGLASDWPASVEPIPEVATALPDGTPSQQVLTVLHDLLEQCQHARRTGFELALVDGRSYGRRLAFDRAADRLQQIFDRALHAPPTDADWLALRERARALEETVAEKRESGELSQGKSYKVKGAELAASVG